MKTRLLLYFSVLTSFISSAQLTKLDLKLPLHSQIVYADKEIIKACDVSSFYVYKRNRIGDWTIGYKCDTVKTTSEFDKKSSYGSTKYNNFSSFNDAENGIILRREFYGPTSVLLKTSNGGYDWDLLTTIPDSIKYVGGIAFKDFNNFIIPSGNHVYICKNNEFKKLDFDTTSQYKVLFKDGIYTCASTYSQFVYTSTDFGLSWKKFIIETSDSLNLSFKKQLLINGELYMHHTTGISLDGKSISFVSIIDLASGSIKQCRMDNTYDDMLIDKRGNLFMSENIFHRIDTLDSNGNSPYPRYKVDYNFYLIKDEATRIRTSSFKNTHGNNFTTETNMETISFSDSSIYAFDYPDCYNIDMSNVYESDYHITTLLKSVGEIDPISYPQVFTVSAKNGDTLSAETKSYLFDDIYPDVLLSGEKLKNHDNDSILVLLKQLHSNVSRCVTNTVIQHGPVPLAIENVLADEFDTMKIFPNPCSDLIELSGVKSGGLMKIVDNSGSVVLQKQYSPSEKIDVSFLTSGSYTLIFLKKDNSTLRKTFIKN